MATTKHFELSIYVSQFRADDMKMKPATINWPSIGDVNVAKAEQFHKELGKAIKYAKQANIKAGTRGR